MSDDLFQRFAAGARESDPLDIVQRDLRRPLPRRFYKEAHLIKGDGAFTVALDGKRALTPMRRPLTLPTRSAGEAVVAEWARQDLVIAPKRMPKTRIVAAAIDGVADRMSAVRADVVKFAGSDLVCYRAAVPAALAALESTAWDPVVTWARDRLSAPLHVVTGIGFVEQPAAAIAAVTAVVAAVRQPIALAALHTMTTLLGSTLIALAVADGVFSVEAAWEAAHVDEDFQARAWGTDDEALARRTARWREMEAAAQLYDALR